VLTEMAYYVESTKDAHIFIVGLATEILQYRPSTFKFLQGLGYAIYISAFVMDREALGEENSAADEELDHKMFLPKSTIVTPYISAVNLAVLGGGSSLDLNAIRRNISESNLRNRSRTNSITGLAALRDRANSSSQAHASNDIDDGNVGMTLTDSPPLVMTRKSLTAAKEATASANQEATDEQDRAPEEEADQFNEEEFWNLRHDLVITRNRAPTWEPMYPFSYPVGDIRSDESIPDELNFNVFSNVVHLKDGSNSNIYTAMYRGEKVVLKVIKEGMETDAIALHEFDLEYGMLSRMKHNHVIRILGAGYEPRRFMVLEYLSRGTLHDLLEHTESKRGLAMMFRKPTFTYMQLLQRARDMAEALDYMHFRCHPGATIIHRGAQSSG
jgi:hypothetical protein